MSDGPDLAALLGTLEEHDVAFVVAGSVAAAAHGAPVEVPADLDIVPGSDTTNLARLIDALAALDAESPVETGEWRTDAAGEHVWVDDGVERPPRTLRPDDPDAFDHSFLTRFGRLDVVPRIAGSYDDLRRRAARLAIAGVDAWVAHPVDVLAGMTGPRRAKDGPRVRHLRAVAIGSACPSGIGFIGYRTDRFAEMVGMFGDIIGLEVVREAPGATRFRLGADAELHVYADTDQDHEFMTTGPVVGLRVDDVDAMRRRMVAAGLELLTEIERTDAAAWYHLRSPDGTVLEIIGPADATRSAGRP